MQMLLNKQIKVVKDMKRREAAVAAVVEEVRYCTSQIKYLFLIQFSR